MSTSSHDLEKDSGEGGKLGDVSAELSGAGAEHQSKLFGGEGHVVRGMKARHLTFIAIGMPSPHFLF